MKTIEDKIQTWQMLRPYCGASGCPYSPDSPSNWEGPCQCYHDMVFSKRAFVQQSLELIESLLKEREELKARTLRTRGL